MARHRWATGTSNRSPDRLDRILAGAVSFDREPGSEGSSAISPQEPGADTEHIDRVYEEDFGAEDPSGAETSAGTGRRWVATRRAALVAAGCALAVGVWAFTSIDRNQGEVIPIEASPVNSSAPSTSSQGTTGEMPAEAKDGPPAADAEGAGVATKDSAGQPEAGRVVVHVAGAVLSPGVVEAVPGSRVFEVLESAGGALAEADLSAVNLAAVVVDGQQVVIPRVGEAIPPVAANAGQAPSGSAPDSVPLVNLNTAEISELEELPKVGPVLAERIVQWRTEHGAFTRAEELDAIPGIGPAMLEALLPLVTI
ncbi:competence protein ComEA [Arthrobacter pigmenti]|uniref:Competence protein ComEA n=1 Tax=Arthrobacter pigmenti TaxID=271432 RepID=A0A846RGR9_9MICC|nr:ComEA family DNA-binding protein [Arthrobacter pigmenti]NJC22428.1 competence protein ComEA [Arthrobacter pigmenti]